MPEPRERHVQLGARHEAAARQRADGQDEAVL